MSTTVRARCPGARGRNIPKAVVIQLLAESANRCAAPDCDQRLWLPVDGRAAVRIAEIAHILPAGATGPRADDDATAQTLVAEGNLIVLCPNTHTVVDGAPEVFTAEVLRAWKVSHQARLDATLGVQEYPDRASARLALEPVLDENHRLWINYGPESVSSGRPDSEAYRVWQSRALDTIIPNNRLVRRLLDVNRGLLRTGERATLAAFRRHEMSFANRHLQGEFDPTGAVFPREMNDILVDPPTEEDG